MFANDLSDKGQISKIYKKCIHLKNKKQKPQIIQLKKREPEYTFPYR